MQYTLILKIASGYLATILQFRETELKLRSPLCLDTGHYYHQTQMLMASACALASADRQGYQDQCFRDVLCRVANTPTRGIDWKERTANRNIEDMHMGVVLLVQTARVIFCEMDDCELLTLLDTNHRPSSTSAGTIVQYVHGNAAIPF